MSVGWRGWKKVPRKPMSWCSLHFENKNRKALTRGLTAVR